MATPYRPNRPNSKNVLDCEGQDGDHLDHVEIEIRNRLADTRFFILTSIATASTAHVRTCSILLCTILHGAAVSKTYPNCLVYAHVWNVVELRHCRQDVACTRYNNCRHYSDRKILRWARKPYSPTSTFQLDSEEKYLSKNRLGRMLECDENSLSYACLMNLERKQ